MKYTSVAQTTWCRGGDCLTAHSVHQTSPSTVRKPGVMTTSGLAAWAQIGKNAVPQLKSQFGSRETTGNMGSKFSEAIT